MARPRGRGMRRTRGLKRELMALEEDNLTDSESLGRGARRGHRKSARSKSESDSTSMAVDSSSSITRPNNYGPNDQREPLERGRNHDDVYRLPEFARGDYYHPDHCLTDAVGRGERLIRGDHGTSQPQAELIDACSSSQHDTSAIHIPDEMYAISKKSCAKRPARRFFELYLSEHKFDLEDLKDWIAQRATQCQDGLELYSQEEWKRQIARILKFLQSYLQTREDWTEEEFRTTLSMIDRGEAMRKNPLDDPTFTKAQRHEAQMLIHRKTRAARNKAIAAVKRDKKAEESLSNLFDDFSLQGALPAADSIADRLGNVALKAQTQPPIGHDNEEMS